MRHNDTQGRGTINNDVLKLMFRYVICLTYNYLIVDGKISFTNQESG